MRKLVDGLIITLGLGALLLLGFHGGAHECQNHPLFTMQGTAEDCGARDSDGDQRAIATLASR
jgi:hypothetical protein